jgi:hypothetical protein
VAAKGILCVGFKQLNSKNLTAGVIIIKYYTLIQKCLKLFLAFIHLNSFMKIEERNLCKPSKVKSKNRVRGSSLVGEGGLQ